MTDTQKLLADYSACGSEPAFQELVGRYIDLVYSAAVRLVNGDTHLAEDITQTVFADLARAARTHSLSSNVMLGGWLHRHTWFVASKTMRGERRRQLRERQAVEMNDQPDHSAETLAAIAPVLDDAINHLGSADRAAIMLRFFEQQDFRSVGEKLGSNEEAARKRVNRALEKLHSLLTKRGVALSAAALAGALGTQAVTAAPSGLAITVSGAAIATAATGGATSLSLLKIIHIIHMTKLQIGIATAVVAIIIAIPVVRQHQTQARLQAENEALRLKAAQSENLAAENARLAKIAAGQAGKTTPTNTGPSSEILKLRGEVGRLRQENATAAATPKPTGESVLSGLTTDPAMRKLIRDQQKAGMTMIYDGFTKQLKLTKEQSDKFNELQADSIMAKIDHVTTVLRDGKSPEERDQLLAQEDAALQQKLSTLLGPQTASQYQEYNRDLASHLSSEQFKNMMTGSQSEKDAKTAQLYKTMQTTTAAALSQAGLDPNYQTTPILNFKNIASETEAEKSLNLLSSIYDNVAAQASSYLSPEDLKKFKEFQTTAINNSRAALTMNRKMMSPK